MHISPQQFAFRRGVGSDGLIVAVNATGQPASPRLPVTAGAHLVDLLHSGERFPVTRGVCTVDLPACGGRVLASASA